MSVDITGQKFNKLTSIKRAGKDKTGRALWLCKCDCGNMITVKLTDLRTGRRKSCGCLQKERYNIIGQRFGELTVIGRDSSGSRAKFLCRCDCGREIVVRGDSLRSGKTISCGCNKKSAAKIKQLKRGRKLQDHTSKVFFKGTINFLLAGLLSADANDTPEKQAINTGYLQEIYKFCCDYTGDHADYIKRTAGRIKQYLD